MDAEYGEVEMSGRVAGKTFHNFRLLDSVEDADNADFRHGEITVPADFLSSYSDAKGIHIRIPLYARQPVIDGTDCHGKRVRRRGICALRSHQQMLVSCHAGIW